MRLSAMSAAMTCLTLFVSACSPSAQVSPDPQLIPEPRRLSAEEFERLERLDQAATRELETVQISRRDLAWLLVLAHQEREKLRLRDTLRR